jgi:uracil-DNA glycosylase family 4
MAAKSTARIKSIADLDNAVIKCTACPRLVSWRKEVSITKRKSYENEKYWGKPVPGFGPADAKLVIVGLAPGAHGANRTGRIFTGDSSGDWLYRALHKSGLAKIPTSTSIDDGQELFNTRIICAVRCAPPDNKPLNVEKSTCAPFMKREIELLLPTAKTFLVLGNFAWTALISQLTELGFTIPKPKPKFAHGAKFLVTSPEGKSYKVVGSFHPSQQNTFTGKLTEKMLNTVILESVKHR